MELRGGSAGEKDQGIDFEARCWRRTLADDCVPRYPPKMIPGIDIVVCTTATNDKDARLLLSSMGVPFYGKHVN